MNNSNHNLSVGNSLEDLFQEPSIHPSGKKKKDEISESELKPLDTIYIHPIALKKMFWMAEAVYSVFHEILEVYALCLGKDQCVYDIIIPKQTVSYTSVYIEPESIHELRPQLAENPYDVLGWTHSHANFGVFFSGTDNLNQKTILHDTSNFSLIQDVQIKYVIGMTVNMNHQAFGVVSTQFPSGKISHVPATIMVKGIYPKHWEYSENLAKLRTEIREKVNFHSSSRRFRKQYAKKESMGNKSSKIDDISNLEQLQIDRFLKEHASHAYSDESIRELLAEFLTYTQNHNFKSQKNEEH